MEGRNKFIFPTPGMTVRQYYAAAALTGFISGYSAAYEDYPSFENAAKKAFEYADALIKHEVENDPQA